MTLALRLFGVPTLLADEIPQHLSRRKAMALLAYLAVTGTRHHRESLSALLWPESDASAAYSALRNVLWILRQTPLHEAVQSDRNTVELADRGILDVDVRRFRALTAGCGCPSHDSLDMCAECEPNLRTAVNVWQGAFMNGFTISNSIQFDDWQSAEREALRRELTEVLDRMIRYYKANENWTDAAHYARRWLRVDGLNELGYRYLMQALAAQGKRREALQVYEDCVRSLQTELGLAPEAATIELSERLRTSPGLVPREEGPQMSRLPHTLVPLIGRRETSAKLEQMLVEANERLVTLVGLGGSGKTSLALHVAREVEKHFRDGAYFIALDSPDADNVVASTVARALGLSVSREPSAALSQQLADFVTDRHMLILLDGVERVLPQVVSLLPVFESAPHVQLLVTSRIALRTKGEAAVAISGLAFPDAETPQNRIADFAAVRLLRIAAQRQGNAPEGGASELSSMARLARILEGSPLGLEMAAGWRSVLTWDEIADRVSDSLEFLVHMREDVAPKHRTFAAIFEQSWTMLPGKAQTALSRLSVMSNSFTIDAAEHVSGSHPGHLALLVNRCLLRRVGPDRYEMHELLRQFASGKLGATGAEVDDVLNRHAAFYVKRLADGFRDLTGPKQFAALESLDDEMPNIRRAVQRAADIGDAALLGAACEGLFFYYDMRTQFEEAKRLFDALAKSYARYAQRGDVTSAFLSIAAGWFAAHSQPDFSAARMNSGLDALGEDCPTSRLHAIGNVICAYACSGDTGRLVRAVTQSIAFYRAQQDRWGEGLSLGALAVLKQPGDEAEAEALAYQSLRLHREVQDAWGEGLVLMFLATLAEEQGHLELALARYEESQRLSEPIGADIAGVLNAIAGQARVIGKLGDAERSAMLADDALQLSRGTGNRLLVGRALIEAARAQRLTENTLSAKQLLEEAFGMLAHRDWSDLQATCARMLLDLALENERVGDADRWLRELASLTMDQDELSRLAERVHAVRAGKKGETSSHEGEKGR